MRTKEFANDYRYFPCPDLVPTEISTKLIEEVRNSMDELPDEKEQRFKNIYKLDDYEAKVLCAEKVIANFFEEVSKKSDALLSAKWIIGELNALLNKNNISLEDSKITVDNFSNLIIKIKDGTISGKIAKDILEEIWDTGNNATEIIKSKGLEQISDEKQIEKIAQSVIDKNPNQVEAYNSGKDKLFGYFVGQVMKETQGKANPKSVNEILKRLLSS